MKRFLYSPFLVTAAALAVAGFFIAAIGPEIDPRIGPMDDPGTAGKFDWRFVLGFGLVLGWAIGAGAEAAWREPERRDEVWLRFGLAVLARLVSGVLVFFVVLFTAFGFEALGVGFG
jgi:hypothetical protein